MLKLLNKPSLPENKVDTVIMSGENIQFVELLKSEYKLKVITNEPNLSLTDDISSHADCTFLHLDNNTVIVDKENVNIVNYLTIGEADNNIIIGYSEGEIKSPYPNDVRLNARVISDKIICNTKYIDNTVIQFAQEHSYKLIHVNQGYSACSTVIINDNALITDDESIYKSSAINGIDSLLISKGSVKLKGREYGFIGGTCGMIDKNLLAFTGCLDSHNDSESIKVFLNKYNVNYIELSKEPLIDVGGIIPVFEHI